MGMTIDKAISHLGTYSHTLGSHQTTQAQHEDAKRVAMDIMRKYQKIAEIVSTWQTDTWTDGVSYDCMVKISEVIEDGECK